MLTEFRGPGLDERATVVNCIGAGIYVDTNTCDEASKMFNALAENFVRGKHAV